MNRIFDSSATLRPWTALALAALLVGCGEQDHKHAATPRPAPEVKVAQAAKESIPVLLQFAGTVESVRSVDIVPQVSGRIEKRSFEEGTFVEKGAPLYLIDPRPFQAALDAAEAQLHKDQANVRFWSGEAARYTRLAKAGAGSKEDKEKALARLAETKAAVAADKADVATARLNLAYTDITAPFDGRIEDTNVYGGDVVTAQRNVLTTLVQIDPIHVVFNISRREGAEVQKLQVQGLAPAERTEFETRVRLPDGTTYEQAGHLDFVALQVDPTTDTLAARAVFPNKSDEANRIALLPGQYVALTLTAGKQPDAILIPGSALVQSQIGAHVFVVDKDGKVALRVVEVDRAYEQQWVIRKGLEAGERVVVDGVQKVRSGMTVKATADVPGSGKG